VSRMCTRPSRSRNPIRFHSSSSFGVVTLLFLLLTFAPLMGQMPVVSGLSTAPRSLAPSVSGVVTAVDGNVVTILGSQLLTLDLTDAIIVPLDADTADAAPPPMAPGAYIVALVDASSPPGAAAPPPPLKVIRAGIRPAGTALLSGVVESVGTDGFALLFRTILVDAGTVFRGSGSGGPVTGLSDLTAGMQVEVWARATGDTLTAVRVMVLGPADVPRLIHFRGVVQAIGSDSWTIGDVTVGVTSDTKIVGDPKVGDTADVVAQIVDPPNPMMGMPSKLVAISIIKVVAPPPPVPGTTTTFTGLVQAMSPSGREGIWRIGDRKVTVTGRTTIEGNPTVGSLVSVTGYSLPNPMANAGAATPSAMAFIATDIKTVP
jgi:hypothetical protein